MSVEQMAMDLKNNIEELTAEIYRRYCSSPVLSPACNTDLTFSCSFND